jgi:large repetitive protein
MLMKPEERTTPAVSKGPLFFFLFLTIVLAGNSQNLAQHNWYFGNSINAIRFNRATNKPYLVTDKSIPFGTGGSAVATDPATADLLFYTDGANVYNTFGTVMPNGSGLLANSSANQPVVISPVPGDSTKYFIFTNTANYTTGGSIAVSIVDMTLFGGSVFPQPALGDLKNPKNVAVAGLSNRSEGMIVIPHADGKDYWLITHQNGSQNYSATLINAASYTAGTFTTTVTNGLGLPTSVANFSYNRKNKKLAVSAQVSNTDATILAFNNATGALTFDRYLYNTGTATTQPQSIYDIQWDNAGQYLYISRVGETGINADVLQYDYNNPSNTLTSVLKTPEFRSWGLQLAPDSTIYHIYQTATGGPFLVEQFSKTDTIASSVIETALPFGPINFSGTQFSAFIPKVNVTLTLSFTSVGTCQNNNTTFFPNVYPNADSLHWDFGDTTSVTAWSPVHVFKLAKTYTVTLTAYYQGKTQTVTQPVTMTAFSLQLQLVSDTTACACQLPANHLACSMPQFSVTVKTMGGNPISYTWSNGQTGATLKPDSAGFYYVVVADASGCSAYAGVTVKQYGKNEERKNIWYFGNKAGIDFNKMPPKALNTSAMDTPAGCAIECDQNGQVIFYTDGNSVWNRNNIAIASGIGGDSTSSQSAMIIPVPNDATLYYIFTTQAINGFSNNEMRYSLFDLKMNNGTGGITQKNILLFAKSTERITGNDQWLIAHEYGNNTFRAYPITAKGVGDPVYSAIGSVHSFEYAANGQGYMKLGPKNDLAVALSTPGVSNLVEVFHFHDSTGTFSNYRKINLNHPAGQVYGIEFSPGGNKLFASIENTPNSDIFEYSFDSLARLHFKKDNVEASTIGALQLAPDNQIYYAINNSTVLGTIQANEDTTMVSSITPNGFTLAPGTLSYLGLPNFRQEVGTGFGGPSFTFTGHCLGDSTKFVGTPTDAIDKFQWFFGDGGSATTATPAHLYAAAGTYNVQMRLTNRCGLDTTITQAVKINPPPASPSIPPTSTICTTPITLNANLPGTPGLTYAWSTGDTTKIITVQHPAFISVTNTDKNGCTSTGLDVVVDNRPQVALGPNATICQNNFTPNLDAQNPGANYVWTIQNVTTGVSTPGSTSEFQSVNTSVPGIFQYGVTVIDPVTNCQVSAQINFTVVASPTFTLTGTNPTACLVNDGKISLAGIASTNLYTYLVTGPGLSQQGMDQSTATQGPFGGLGAGTYTGIVTDQVSGCTISKTFGLSNNAFTATPSVSKACDPPSINVNTNASAFPLQYLVTNGSNGQAVSGTVATSVTNFTVQLPSQGTATTITYTIQVTDLNGCVRTNNLPITTSAPLALSITPPLCSALVKANGPAGTSYVWSSDVPGSIIGATNSNPIQMQPGIGSVTLTLTGTDAGGCATTINQNVYISPSIAPAFTQSDPCQNQVVLTATPVGNYTYRWYENGSATPTQIGQQIGLTSTDNGSSFILQIVDVQSGCTVQSASKQVQVVGPVTASLTASLACDNGKPFTLTAATNVATPTYAWFLNGTPIANASSSTLQETNAGTYKVVISLASCKDSTAIQIIKAPIPVGNLIPATTICSDPDNHNDSTKTKKLDPGFFSAYNWFKNDVQLSPPYTSRAYVADSPGLYRVELTNTFGCTNGDSTVVTNNCIPVVTAPNAFRPGSTHSINQNFQVFSFFITNNFEVIIYNRWGEVVFESTDRGFLWNGGYKNNPGQPLPGETYVYLVRYISSYHPDQGVQELRGGVVLLR